MKQLQQNKGKDTEGGRLFNTQKAESKHKRIKKEKTKRLKLTNENKPKLI